MNVAFEEGSNIVKELQLGYGGMAPTTVLAKATSNKLIGRCVNVDCDATQIIIHISMHVLGVLKHTFLPLPLWLQI